jgi:hypothetical protein
MAAAGGEVSLEILIILTVFTLPLGSMEIHQLSFKPQYVNATTMRSQLISLQGVYTPWTTAESGTRRDAAAPQLEDVQKAAFRPSINLAFHLPQMRRCNIKFCNHPHVLFLLHQLFGQGPGICQSHPC